MSVRKKKKKNTKYKSIIETLEWLHFYYSTLCVIVNSNLTWDMI